MNFHQPLRIHKSAWERLKRQTEQPEQPVKHNEKYLKEIIQKSQQWIKAWPDSTEGYIKKLREEQKKQHEKDLALLKERKKMKLKTFKADTVKRAKIIIFDDSCYGKQLISAFIESKTLEERDAQIEYQKQIKYKSIEHEESTTKPYLYCTFNLDENQEKDEEQKKMYAIECINENKWMQQQKERETKNLKQQREEIKFTQMNENQHKNEIMQSEHQKSLKEFESEQKIIKERRKRQDELNDALNKVCATEQERRKCKMQHVLDKIHKDKQETVLHKQVYKIIEECQQTKHKRYQFIDDRIKLKEQQDLKKDTEDAEKAKIKRNELKAMSQFNKTIESYQQKHRCSDKWAGDKYLTPASCEHIKSEKHANRARNGLMDKMTFLKPQNKLVDELKKRTKEPSAWSGTKATHEQFAKVAGEIIQECKYKNIVRKVVDKYRRLHNLDSTSLPVPNLDKLN